MANEIDSKILNIFKGSLEHIPEQNSSLIRLFLSSTTSGEFLDISKHFIFFHKIFSSFIWSYSYNS